MLKDWLKLACVKKVTPSQKRALVELYGSPSELFILRPAQLEKSAILDSKGIAQIQNITDELVQQDIEQLSAMEAGFIGFTDPLYPALLNKIDSAPLGLFYKGDITLLQSPQVAMVGSRNPSPSGRRTAQMFAWELAKEGFTITSGMAAGIDSDAHKGALGANGKTIAILGTGLDINYPKSNTELQRTVEINGLVVSEYPLGSIPRKAHFPQRNRIISGLSLGTLVVEAGVRSGSLITARLAGEQGREVFAVPGSIHVPVSRGCHHLIKQGAKLVETVSDITEELGQYFCPPPSAQPNIPKVDSNQADPVDSGYNGDAGLFGMIDYTPVSIDQLATQSGLTIDEVTVTLLELELQGLVIETVSGYQRAPQQYPDDTSYKR